MNNGGLQVENLCARYENSRNVLNGVSFSLESGQVMLVQGKNGSGKSTLLKVLAGLLPRQSGSISWKGAGLESLKAGKPVYPWVGFMMQTAGVFTNLTVEDNLKLAHHHITGGRAGGYTIKYPGLSAFISPLLKKRAGLLSGGERKMLGFAMALASDSQLLLLDEPLSGLNEQNTAVILGILKSQKETGKAVVIVEHSDARLMDGLTDISGEMIEGVLSLTKTKPSETSEVK